MVNKELEEKKAEVAVLKEIIDMLLEQVESEQEIRKRLMSIIKQQNKGH